MKQILSVLVLLLFITSASFASFPVDKADSKSDKTKVESNEKDVKDSAISMKKIEKAKAKFKMKVKKVLREAPAKAVGEGDTTAIILALVSVILLPLGLHNWYLKRTSQALWQTILFLLIITAPISWIWQIVDLIRLLGPGLP